MEENKTIFSYIGQLFVTYGMTVFFILLFDIAIGEMAQPYSSLFVLGRGGLTAETLLQLFLMAVLLTVAEIAFMSDLWIRNMRLVIRYSCFFAAMLAVVVACSILFQWFPAGEIKAWIGFALSFLFCSGFSIFISRLKEKSENRKMDQALKKIQQADRV